MRPTIRAIALTALAVLAVAASAQSKRPAAAGRIVRVFGFEERDTNPLPVPAGWYRAQQDPDAGRRRPGFPVWNQGELDYEAPAYSGIGSVRLPTKGGSTSLVTRPALIGVFPGADYMVSVRVRTEGLVHARARLVASLVDQGGSELAGTRRASDPIRSSDGWRLVTLFVPGVDDAAATLRLELQVLQPKQQPRELEAPEFKIWPQDYAGAAWFDDLLVAQIPRIELSIGAPSNISFGSAPPPIGIGVRDMTGDSLTTRIRVLDADARVVDAARLEHGAASLDESWTPDLPRRGWYRAHLEVTASGRIVGRRTLDFAWLAPIDEPLASSFSIACTSTDPRLIGSIPAAARAAGVARVEATASDPASDPSALAQGSALTRVIDELIDREIGVAIALAGIPRGVARRASIEPMRVRELLTDRSEVALPLFGPLMDRYGQIVTDWRLGRDGAEDDGRTLGASVERAVEVFAPYVPGARIAVPWPIDRIPSRALLRDGVTLSVADDPDWGPDAFDDLGALWRARRDASSAEPTMRDAHPPGFELRHRARDASPHDVRVRENAAWLARRAVSAWWALLSNRNGPGSVTLTLEDPMRLEPGARGRLTPAPELVVWRTLAEHLGTRRPVRELSLIPGVRMLLCSAPRGSTNPEDGALVVWRTSPDPVREDLRLPLAGGAVAVHGVMGARRVVGVRRVTALELPLHEIRPTRSPMIITGVNTRLLELLDSITIDPPRLDASAGLRTRTLTIENPWDVPIRGKVFIVEPGGYADESTPVDRSWEIDPRVVGFSATAREALRIPIGIAYSPAQIAGAIPFVFDIELSADRAYPLMRLEREIPLGSDLVELELALRRDPETGRVGVRAIVTNTGEEPMLIEVGAIATRHARQESTISAIDPGVRAERRFVFDDLRPGDAVVVSARSDAAGVLLNRRVVIP